MRCMVSSGSHYYNLIDDELIDLTVEQFLGEIPLYTEEQEQTREYLLGNEDTRNRYLLLNKNLKNTIKQEKELRKNRYQMCVKQRNEKEYKLIDSNGKEYISTIPGTLGGNKKLKIYGLLNCQSAKKWIDKGHYISNRVFFKDETTAIEAGYRPCAVCMPKKYQEWKNNEESKKIYLKK